MLFGGAVVVFALCFHVIFAGEPQCLSRFDYDEKMLLKLLRIEDKLEHIEQIIQDMKSAELKNLKQTNQELQMEVTVLKEHMTTTAEHSNKTAILLHDFQDNISMVNASVGLLQKQMNVERSMEKSIRRYRSCPHLSTISVKEKDCPDLYTISTKQKSCPDLSTISVKEKDCPDLSTISTKQKSCPDLSTISVKEKDCPDLSTISTKQKTISPPEERKSTIYRRRKSPTPTPKVISTLLPAKSPTSKPDGRPTQDVHRAERREAADEIRLCTGRTFSSSWPSFVHHCKQVKEIWLQYHDVLSALGLRLNEDILKKESVFLSNFYSVPVYFAFVGFTPTERSYIAKKVSNMIYRGAKVATIFDHANLETKAFENICSQNHIAPLVIICHVDAEKQAFLHGETYRKSIKPERECIFVVVCEMTHCDHKITDCNRLTAYTCDKEAMVIEKAIEKLLKRWAYMMLAERVNTIKLITEFTTDLSSSEFIQQLSNHGIEKEEGAWKHIDERIYLVRKLKELLEESRALYSRNHLPTEDWPTFSPESKIPVKMIFDQIAKHHYVVGCGNRFGTLLILVDEKVENRNKIEETLQSEMKDFKTSDFALKYVSKRIRYFIKSGDTIDCNNEKSFGTLAGFALQDTNDNPAKQRLVALFSRHVADMCTKSKLKVEGVIIGDILDTTDEGVDIAAAEVFAEHVDACNSKFVTEKNIEKTCEALDPYKVELAGMLVHLVGAASEEIGLGKIAVINFHSKQAHTMNTILLENRVTNTHAFCEPGDSGAMILSYFPDDGKLMALGMLIGSVEKKNEEYTDKFAKPFTSSKKKVRAKNVQNDACQWYAAFFLKEGLEQLSKIHDGRFFLVGEKKNPSAEPKQECANGCVW